MTRPEGEERSVSVTVDVRSRELKTDIPTGTARTDVTRGEHGTPPTSMDGKGEGVV